jgi:hypothetical protein
MYYYHNEEGFWVHFCRLMDVQDTPQNDSWLGEMLEAQLLNFGFLNEPGYGPFRYVTPMREQCGITRSEIPRFAELLLWLANRNGWDGIRVLDQSQFSDITLRHFPTGHLTRFLTGEQGYYFVRDVARNISQFQRHILSLEELKTLTGYRTGFFAELFDAIGRAPSSSVETVARPPLPRLLFLPEYRQVGLCFDPAAIMKERFKIDGEMVRQNPLLWQNPTDYQLSITGARRDANGDWSSWAVPGWDARVSPVALFHVDRGFIDHKQGVTPGDYFMLGPYENPPPDAVLQGDYGMVDLPFPDLELDAWRIVIKASSDVSFLGVEKPADTVSTDLIDWSDAYDRLPGTLETAMAFTGSLPALSIFRPELFLSNAVALFLDDGKETRRIRISSPQGTVSLDVCAPSQGRLWVEPIGRLREFAGRDTLCELQYYLLPDCEIRWPGGLYSLDERPEVALITQSEDLSLELENARPLDESRRCWQVKASAMVMQGRLRTQQFDVPLAHRIYRAFLRQPHHRLADYLLPKNIEAGGAWILSGIPNESATLVLADGSSTLPLGTIGRFNNAGECRFPASAVRDTISKWKTPVGCIGVNHFGEIVRTGTLFVDCSELVVWMSDPEECKDPTWLGLLNGSLRQLIKTAIDIRTSAPKTVDSLAGIDSLPQDLKTFFETVRACAAVFDDAFLPDRPELSRAQIATAQKETSPTEGALLLWYLQAEDFVRAVESARGLSAKSLLEKYDQVGWQPPFPRWQKAMEEVLDHIKADEEAVPLVVEWKSDVDYGFRGRYTSRIAIQNSGPGLTNAWIQYRHFGNHQLAINNAMPLATQSFSPVAELVAILLVICFMRRGLFQSKPHIQIHSTNRKLGAAYRELKAVAELGAATEITMRPKSSVLSNFLPVLPLREEDAAMINAIRVGGAPEMNEADSDWLSCYLQLRLAEFERAESVRFYAERLRGLINDVPASPDRYFIKDAIERNL